MQHTETDSGEQTGTVQPALDKAAGPECRRSSPSSVMHSAHGTAASWPRFSAVHSRFLGNCQLSLTSGCGDLRRPATRLFPSGTLANFICQLCEQRWSLFPRPANTARPTTIRHKPTLFLCLRHFGPSDVTMPVPSSDRKGRYAKSTSLWYLVICPWKAP